MECSEKPFFKQSGLLFDVNSVIYRSISFILRSLRLVGSIAIRYALLALAAFFTIIGGYAKGPLLDYDRLFAEASVHKAQLNSGLSTGSIERVEEAFAIALEKVYVSAQDWPVDSFVQLVGYSEVYLQDLEKNYQYFESIKRGADGWLSVDQRDVADRCDLYMKLARIKTMLRDFKGAYDFLEQIERLPKDQVPKHSLAKYYFFKGFIAYFAKDYKHALALMKLAQEYSEGTDDYRNDIRILNSIAHCYNKLGDFQKGEFYSAKAIEKYTRFKEQGLYEERVMYAMLLTNFAEANYGLGNKEVAFKNAALSLDFALGQGVKVAEGNAYIIYGRIKRLDKDFVKAKELLLLGLEAFASVKDVHYELIALSELVDYATDVGDYKSAFEYSGRHNFIKDSLDDRRLLVESEASRLAIESQKQKAELQLLKEVNGRQEAEARQDDMMKLVLAALACLFVLVSIGIAYRLRLRKTIQAQLEEEVANRTQALTAQAKKLQESNKELERFAYIASHDLKTPLRNVVSFLNLIERNLPAEHDEALTEYLDIASKNAKMMHHLVSDVLEFSKVDSDIDAMCSRFSLQQLFVTEVFKSFPKNVNLSVVGEAQVNAPRPMLLQVFKNLIENGIKYNDSSIPTVKIEIIKEDEFILCAIKDNGIGIEEQYQDRVFELFKRLHTSDRYEGTGLGLALCKKILTRLGGDITITRSGTSGTVFLAEFPINCATEKEDFVFMQQALAESN